jgi:regulator of RNase E activity RraA
MILWKDDKELYFIARKELFTALVGDILDKMGYLHQFLPPGIKPVCTDMVVIGRAMPVLEADVSSEIVEKNANPIIHKPFGMMFEALDNLKEDEVYICTGSSHSYALWGGLMSSRAIRLNAAGAVVNGYSRDTNEILRLCFPTFSVGTYAQDQGPRGKVVDFRIPIEWGGVKINPGDIIFGDRDGVLVVPCEIEKEAFTGALEKARGEKKVMEALQYGMSSVDAFNKYGIM